MNALTVRFEQTWWCTATAHAITCHQVCSKALAKSTSLGFHSMTRNVNSNLARGRKWTVFVQTQTLITLQYKVRWLLSGFARGRKIRRHVALHAKWRMGSPGSAIQQNHSNLRMLSGAIYRRQVHCAHQTAHTLLWLQSHHTLHHTIFNDTAQLFTASRVWGKITLGRHYSPIHDCMQSAKFYPVKVSIH